MFTSNAAKKYSCVTYPKGTIQSSIRVVLVREYAKIDPDAHRFVPEKPNNPDNTKENILFLTTQYEYITAYGNNKEPEYNDQE